jgi:hypothetical protein
MAGGRPNLTFFVELGAEPLEELFDHPEVLPFLVEQRCSISMAILDLSPPRAAVVRKLESSGVPVTAWLVLDVEDGYWLNADNSEQALERWRQIAAWAGREDLELQRVGLDIEFPRTESEGAIRDKRQAFFSMLKKRRSQTQIREAERAYQGVVEEIRSSGRSVEVYQFAYLLDERAAGSMLLRRSLGLVDIDVDTEVYMLYSSYMGRAGAEAYFADAECIALGVTGGGVNAQNPEARPLFLSWQSFGRVLRTAAAHSREVYVFSLEGCVEQDMLASIADLDWEEPVPPVPPQEERQARWNRLVTRWLLRAEPLFDVGLPSRRREEP